MGRKVVVMIDINAEQLVPLREVPQFLPRRAGRKVHISTVYRWTQRGVRGIQLESVRVGGSTYTSREAMQRFAERLSQPGQVQLPGGPATTRTRQQQIERAAREVERIFGRREGPSPPG
jgi:transposase